MDELSNSILRNIINYLQFDDLLILRNVNLRFCNLIDNLIRTKLIWFKNYNKELNNYYLFHLDEEKIIFNNCLVSYSLINFRTNTNVHCLIRKLITYNPYILLDLVFENLEHLEIVNKSFKKNPEINFIHLNLDKLEVLKIDLNKKPLTFFLNCISLDSFHMNGSLEHFKLCNPEQLRNLTCNTSESLKSFKNLNNLIFLEFTYLNYCGNLLNELSKLDKIQIYQTDLKSLEKLRNDKIESRKQTPIIYFKDCNIEADKFNYDLFFNLSTTSLNQNQIELFIKRLNHLNETMYQKSFYKVDLENVPYELLLKFDYLDEIILSINLRDLEKWKLILLLYRLKTLKIKVALDQQYLNLIPFYQSTLRYLKINRCNDMNFVLQLTYLKELHTKQFLSKELFKKMLERFNLYLETVCILKYFVFNLDIYVVCKKENKLTFKESKNLFLSTTINFIDQLDDLFKSNVMMYIEYCD